MKIKFGSWLKDELIKARINQTDLALKIGLQPPQISRIISGDRGTSIEVLEGIANVLKIPPEVVFRAAAGLPTKTESDEWVEEMKYKISQIPPELRPTAGRVIAGFVEEETKVSRPARREPKASPVKS
ncbi:MAG TPA: hypothetical protein DCS05_08065 [Nitrospiraceae bacterium]|nr:hypothetical protein [Nitrospiraceae bacterium]